MYSLFSTLHVLATRPRPSEQACVGFARTAAATLRGGVAPLGLVALLAACGNSTPRVLNPERQSEAEYDLARDYYYRGDKRGALDHANRAIELQEDNARALYFTALVYADFCDGPRGLEGADCKPDRMEDYSRRAVKADEAMRDAKNLLGQVLIVRKKYAAAAAVLEPLTRDPAYGQSHLAWGNYGWALVEGGKLDEGIRALRNSVTEPRFCVGHYRLGVAYERKRDFALADQVLTTALGADPQCKTLQDAWWARARVRLALNKTEDARADLAECQRLSADSVAGVACTKLVQALPAVAAPPAAASSAVEVPAVPVVLPVPATARPAAPKGSAR
jgi:type IV pilus assembly protein PilF